jgi:hypothetical protein
MTANRKPGRTTYAHKPKHTQDKQLHHCPMLGHHQMWKGQIKTRGKLVKTPVKFSHVLITRRGLTISLYGAIKTEQVGDSDTCVTIQ